jgi:hypothetical protein
MEPLLTDDEVQALQFVFFFFSDADHAYPACNGASRTR